MKKIYSIIILAFILVMSSCNENFIEGFPPSSVVIDVMYKTDKDFNDAIIGSYQGLRNQYNNMWQFGDLRGDDSFIQVTNQPTSTDIDIFSINSTNPLLNSTWANYYIVINRASNIIVKLENIDKSVVANKDRYLGEAKFLRALAYFDLVRILGDVQLITGIPSIAEAINTPRTSFSTIYSEIIVKDLIEAISKLPLKYAGKDVGRVTQGAAKAILGRVYLTQKDFTKAESILKDLTAAPYSYTLLPNYNDLFDYTKDEHHSEYIFDIEYEEGLGGLGSPWTNLFMPNHTPLLNYYLIKGGFGESISPTKSFVDLWIPEDKRKDISIQCCGSWKNPTSGIVTTLNSTTSQSYTMKYVTAVNSRNDSRANWKVTRYADVILMYAEALNENGKVSEALNWLNQIRLRAGVPIYSGLSQNQTRDAIALERRFELSFEGHRWFDLVRTGKALAALESTGMRSHMTIFPIPLSQIQVMNNPSIFPQNPGYN